MSLWSEGRIHSAWCPNTNNQHTVGEKEGLGLSEVTPNSLQDERRNKNKAHGCSRLCRKRCMLCCKHTPAWCTLVHGYAYTHARG